MRDSDPAYARLRWIIGTGPHKNLSPKEFERYRARSRAVVARVPPILKSGVKVAASKQSSRSADARSGAVLCAALLGSGPRWAAQLQFQEGRAPARPDGSRSQWSRTLERGLASVAKTRGRRGDDRRGRSDLEREPRAGIASERPAEGRGPTGAPAPGRAKAACDRQWEHRGVEVRDALGKEPHCRRERAHCARRVAARGVHDLVVGGAHPLVGRQHEDHAPAGPTYASELGQRRRVVGDGPVVEHVDRDRRVEAADKGAKADEKGES